MDVSQLIEKAAGWLLTSGLQIALILLLMLIAVKLTGVVANKIFNLYKGHNDSVESQKRTDTVSNLIRNAVNIIIFAVAFMMILQELGINIGPIIAAAGVVGVAVGFGAQKLVEDIISGFFIFLEDQIRVGDVVEIGGKSGLVEKVTLRMVILRDLAGNVHFVRNGEIDTVTNMTKEYSRYVFDIGVSYQEDIDQVIDLVKQVDRDLRADSNYKEDILEPIEILGLDEFADSALIIKARTKTKPIKQWGVAREFNKRLKKVFDQHGIEIPFPHRTLFIGKQKSEHRASIDLNVNQLQETAG